MFKAIIITAITIGTAVLSSAFTLQNQDAAQQKKGKEVYEMYCQNCHMEDGKGTADINPPLAKADYMKKPAKNLIDIILNGQSGEIKVNGKKYNALMPAQNYLSDMQIADVLNYTRNAWGNKIPGKVTPAMVKALRKKG